MTWVRFDDLFTIHRKVRGLSDAAYRLHTEAIFWCARNLTDGLVPTKDVSHVTCVRRPHKFAPELAGRGVWHRTDESCDSRLCPANPEARERQAMPHPTIEGWLIHDYWDYQPSKVKVERERAAKAERQKRWLDKKNGKPKETRLYPQGGKPSGQPKDSERDASQSEVDASQDTSVTLTPYPPRPDKGGGGDAPERASPSGHGRNGAADDARAQAAARALAIANCAMCDDDGYIGTTLCDHDPATHERNARGMALARAALAKPARREPS